MQTPTKRYPCCEHCPGGEGCPKISGHPLPCGNEGCYSYEAIGEQLEPREEVPGFEDIWSSTVDDLIDSTKDEMITRVVELVGFEPQGLRILIKALTHVDVLPIAKVYFDLLDPATKCAKYDRPWNCIREAEARYENIQNGWYGGASGIGFDESWCENCRAKVMSTPVLSRRDEEIETTIALEVLNAGEVE